MLFNDALWKLGFKYLIYSPQDVHNDEENQLLVKTKLNQHSEAESEEN